VTSPVIKHPCSSQTVSKLKNAEEIVISSASDFVKINDSKPDLFCQIL